MILIIDTTDRQTVIIGLHQNETKFYQKQTDNQSADLLKFLQQVLTKSGRKISDIDAILVNQGPGSYTGTRVGVSVANALGWSLNKPVHGYTKEKLSSLISSIGSTKGGYSQPVLPIY